MDYQRKKTNGNPLPRRSIKIGPLRSDPLGNNNANTRKTSFANEDLIHELTNTLRNPDSNVNRNQKIRQNDNNFGAEHNNINNDNNGKRNCEIDVSKKDDVQNVEPSQHLNSTELLDERFKVLEELWETEGSYVQDLEVIVNFYLIPLRDALKNRSNIIDPHDIPKIFSNIEQILNVHTEVLTQLDIQLEKGIDPSKLEITLRNISGIFINLGDSFKVYAEYCMNQQTAIETLNQCSKNSAFRDYEDLTRKSCGQVRLDGFLAKPVQRICKYPLFFRDMSKTTPESSPAYSSLKIALETMEHAANHINEHKKQKENQKKLNEISQCLHGYKKKIQIPSRFFYREGMLMMASEKRIEKLVEYKVYLFSDTMIYAEERGSNSFVYKGELPTHLALVRITPKDFLHPNAFQVKLTEGNKPVYTFCCKNEFERTEWLKDLKKITDEQTRKQNYSSRTVKQLIMSEWK